MPRPKRNQVAGGTYHVTAHAVAEGAIVLDEGDCDRFLEALAITVGRYRWRCLAVTLLDTHYHLLVTIEETNLDCGMQWLNGVYAAVFNRTHRRKGHLFAARYFNGPILDEPHFMMTVRSIARNRTAAGACADPASASRRSYPGVVGITACWTFVDRKSLLSHFGPDDVAAARLRDFVEGD
jgi:REP element-mobilizing transposase RayT